MSSKAGKTPRRRTPTKPGRATPATAATFVSAASAIEQLQKPEGLASAETLLDVRTAEELLEKPRKPKKALQDILELH